MDDRIKILLTGASSIIGKEILKQLILQEKYQITVFDYKTYDSSVFFVPLKNKIKIVYGDITNKSDIQKVTANIDIAIHLAEIQLSLYTLNPEAAFRLNVEGTLNLINSLQEKSPDCFFLASSSTDVYKRNIQYTQKGRFQSSYLGYAESKAAAEQIIKNSFLNWSIFRITELLNYNLYSINAWIFEKALNSELEVITAKDVGRAFVSALEYPKKLSKSIFDLSGGEDCRTTYKNLLSQVFKIYGLGKLNFPSYAFSNEETEIIVDGDILENILSFRHDTLEIYLDELKKSVNPLQRIITSAFKTIIKYNLLKQSLPYKKVVRSIKRETDTPYSPAYI